MSVQSSFIGRLQNRFKANGAGFYRRPSMKKKPPERQVVITHRWDNKAWERARETDIIEEDIKDLYVGDLEALADGDEEARQGYENAPELVRDIWSLLYKPYGRLRPRKELLKDAWFNRKILEELQQNPQFQLLQQKCSLDAVTTTMATDTMMEAVREILTRKGEARDDSNTRRDPNKHPQKGGQKGQSQPQKGGEQGQPSEGGEPGEGGEQGGQPGGEQGQPGEGGGDSQGDQQGQPQSGDQPGQDQGGEGEGGVQKGAGGKPGGDKDQGEDGEDQDGDQDGEDDQESDSDDEGDDEGQGKGQGGDEADQDDWGSEGADGDEDDDEADGDEDDESEGSGSESEGESEGQESDGEGDGEGDGRIDDLNRAWDEAVEEANEREDNARLAELLDGDDGDIERLMNKALNAAMDEVGDLEKVRQGVGLEDGEWKSMDPQKRWEYAERFRTPQMKALAEIVGRMIRFAMGCQATKINDVQHEIYDVTNGDDMLNALHSEYALMATEESEFLFFQRMIDKELLVYKKRGTEEAGKGPIVMAIDKSGSMNGAPFNWAMAVSEALRRICADQDRDYYALFFGNNNDRNRFWFPKGKPQESWDEVFAFLSCVANGGTQFDGVLTEALERVQTQFDDDGEGKADIVFVTDGQAHLDEDWIKRFNEERERVGCKMYSIFVGGARDYYDGTNRMMEFLRLFSDEVIPVSEFKPESVREIFSRV